VEVLFVIRSGRIIEYSDVGFLIFTWHRVKFVCEINDEISEYLRVDVLAELHQDEPLPVADLLHDEKDVLLAVVLGTTTEDISADRA